MASISVFLNVQDIERSLAFYDQLGFKAQATYKRKDGRLGWADLALDGAELGLGEIASNDDPEFRQWVSSPLGAGVVVYVTVDDVDEMHRRAVAAGATIEHAPETRSYGRVCTINDPDEYTIAFLQETS